MAASYADTQLKNALKAGRKREYKKAIVILEDLAARGLGEAALGGNPDVHLYLARSWHAEGMFSRSAVCARTYIRQRPDDGAGWFFLGRSCLADGLYDRAISALSKSVRLNPQSIDARTLLGMAYLRARKPLLAKNVFEEALTLAPDDPRLNQGYLNALFVEAVHTFKRGDAETARQMLTFLINNDIDGVVPRLYLAHALRELGYLAESLGQYEAAIQFAPDDEALRWYPVAILLELGEAEKAAELMAGFGDIPGVAPGANPVSDQMINLMIIKNHLEQGEWVNAVQAARSYIRTYGSDAQVHALMGEAQRNLGNREESLNHFNRALDIDRANSAPRYGILMLLVSSRDWAALRPELAKAEKGGCDQDIIRYYRVLCEANLDAAPESLLPALQEQVLVHGAVPELIVALARTYFRLGLSDLALPWYRKAIELENDNEDAHLGHIACLEAMHAEGSSTSDGHPAGDALGASYASYLALWADNQSIRRDYIKFLVGSERWEEAADQSEILQAQDPSLSVDRTVALYRRKAGQYRKAAILYRTMLRAKSDDRALLANLVFCLDRMGEGVAALQLMKEANRTFKADAEALMIEGRLCARTGDMDGALKVFRKVVDKWPTDERGWLEIAAIYTRQGVPEMAAVYTQKARDITKKPKKRA